MIECLNIHIYDLLSESFCVHGRPSNRESLTMGTSMEYSNQKGRENTGTYILIVSCFRNKKYLHKKYMTLKTNYCYDQRFYSIFLCRVLYENFLSQLNWLVVVFWLYGRVPTVKKANVLIKLYKRISNYTKG